MLLCTILKAEFQTNPTPNHDLDLQDDCSGHVRQAYVGRHELGPGQYCEGTKFWPKSVLCQTTKFQSRTTVCQKTEVEERNLVQISIALLREPNSGLDLHYVRGPKSRLDLQVCQKTEFEEKNPIQISVAFEDSICFMLDLSSAVVWQAHFQQRTSFGYQQPRSLVSWVPVSMMPTKLTPMPIQLRKQPGPQVLSLIHI